MNRMPNDVFDLFGENADPIAVGILYFVLICYFLALCFIVVSYVLNCVGMHSIAKRRGIRNPWLAWVPVASSCILGSISDQYQYVAKGKIRNRRALLLTMNILVVAVYVVLSVVAVYLPLAVLDSAESAVLPLVLFVVIAWIVMVALLILNAVFTYIALYDLYSSCNPNNAVTFLLLSIFLSVTQPFFVFGCRKKDLGMTPENQSCVPAMESTQVNNL